MNPRFSERLGRIQEANDSLVCVGLDPDPQRMPPHLLRSASLADAVLSFNLTIIEATAPFACAFKLNFAFYEALGSTGWSVLEATVRAARQSHIVIADAKRGDIGNSARFYAEAVFGALQCDACTVAPYMGSDSVVPFLQYPGRAAFVLVRTSNPGAAELQELDLDGAPLYTRVANQALGWSEGLPGELGFVVGATDAAPAHRIRSAHSHVPLLIPGIGAQGGDPAPLMEAITRGSGRVLVNNSRGIIYASAEQDFAAAAARAAERFRDLLRATSRDVI